jgi:hypothetical protein
MSPVSTQPGVADAPSKRRRWRFSLGTLILATALGLAIPANYLQYRDVQATKRHLWGRHTQMSEELNGLLRHHELFDRMHGEDESLIHVSLVPTGSNEEWLWQITLPEHQRYRIFYAVEGIPSDGLPSRWSFGQEATGPTWLKVRLHAEGRCNMNRPPDDDAVLVAVQSFRRAHLYDPSARLNYHPGIHCCDLPRELHLWSVIGRDRRESFAPDAPPALIRMRTLRPETMGTDEAEMPGPGFMIWLEKLSAK